MLKGTLLFLLVPGKTNEGTRPIQFRTGAPRRYIPPASAAASLAATADRESRGVSLSALEDSQCRCQGATLQPLAMSTICHSILCPSLSLSLAGWLSLSRRQTSHDGG